MNLKELVPYLDEEVLKECLSSDAFIVPFNPYSSIFPFRTAFRGFDLDLGKRVSKAGYRVAIPRLKETPRREVVLQKHFDFSNPLVLFVIGIPYQLLISILGNLITDLTKKGASSKILVVEITSQGKVKRCYDEKGNIVPNGTAQEAISKINTAPLYVQPRPESDRPIPIFLEHTPKVVGWAEAILTKKNGLFIKNAIIDDGTAWQLIKVGKLIGFSVGGIAREYECSLCHKDYFTCEHIKGKTYNGKKASCEIKKADFAEVSLVSDPTNIDCRIKDVKCSSKIINTRKKDGMLYDL